LRHKKAGGKCFLAGCAFVFLIAAAKIPTAEKLTIQVHLFRGSWAEDHPALGEVTVLTAASHPAVEALKARVGGPESEMTAAAIDALLEALGLKTVDDILAFAVDWDGQEPFLVQNILHKTAAFQFAFSPKLVSRENVELAVALGKSKEAPAKDEKSGMAEAHRALLEGRLDKILDEKLDLDIGEPVIVAVPTGKEPFFLMLVLTKPTEAAGPARVESAGSAPEGAVIPTPKAIRTVIPAYPEELRKEGVRGIVELETALDEKGNPMGIKITKSLHPYLDFAAVQALRQWRYEACVQNGKPVPVIITQTVNFDPEVYRAHEEKAWGEGEHATGGEPRLRKELANVLEGSAEYCRRLAGAALGFICEERIGEIHYNFAKEMNWQGIAVSPRGSSVAYITTWIPQWDPARTERHDYICDYLFVKKGDSVEERRIILKDNGRTMPDRSRFLEEKRFTALNPLLAAVHILGRDRQSLFNFRVIDTDRIHGHEAYVIEAIPKSGNTWGVEYAKIWIDRTGYQILKSEIQGVPLEGYNDVLADTTQFNIKPILTTSHTYEVEKNGVLFPARTTIRVDYPEPQAWFSRTVVKLKIDMEYDKYKFFTVETEGEIKK
jgi:TonB family protein